MNVLLPVIIGLVFGYLGKVLFKKWFNHLSIYVYSWMLFLLLYEIKLIKYIPLSENTWVIIGLTFFSYLMGIATVFVARNNFNLENNPFRNVRIFDEKLLDNKGHYLKLIIIFFIVIAFISAVQHWMILIDKFGSVANVLIKANLIYRQRVSGELTGTLPYLHSSGYIAVFLSGIYSAYKNKITLLSILSILTVILKDVASVGRAGIFVSSLIFVISFVLYRNFLLKCDIKEKIKNKNNLIISGIIISVIVISSLTLVKEFRGSVESYSGSSTTLKKLKDVPVVSPSVYLYFSSNVGVLSRYFEAESENMMFGENTFLPIYNLISKFDIVKHPNFYPRGYFIPMWTNSATYLRDLHADFGYVGLILIPYLLGLLATYYWIRFYETGSIYAFIVLTYLYQIISFSIFYMITRSAVWFISFLVLLILVPMARKVLRKKSDHVYSIKNIKD